MTTLNNSGVRKVTGIRSKAIRKKNLPNLDTKGTTRKMTHPNEETSELKNRTLNIEPLKVFANQNLPRGHPLRKLLLAERSLLNPDEYLAKLESWQCLLRESK